MKSFIPWVGGKSKLLWLIHKLSPSRYSRFIDVFGGSGTVTLSRPIQQGCIEVYNDFNGDLTNLFCCVKNRTMALLLELGFLPLNTRDDFNVLYKFFSREEFTDDYLDEEMELTQRYLEPPDAKTIRRMMLERAPRGDVRRAADYFKLIRYSFSGGAKSFAGKSCDIRRFFHLVWECSRRLAEVVIENKDCVDLIRQYDREDAFFYAGFAQSESESISKNITWSVRKKFEEGTPVFIYKRFLGYKKGADGEPEIVPSEAAIVERIFNLYLAGETVDIISKMMQAENYDIPDKTISFSKGMIMNMLSNERYCGDVILQKSVTVDCIEKKRKKNTGEAPMYYVQNNHPAIIDRVTFNKVQEELARRKTKTPGSAKSSITSSGKYSRYALTDVLICGNCGTRYRRVTWSRNGTKRIVWRCISRLDYGKKYCSDSPTIMEDKLQEAIVRAVNKFNEQDNATYKALMRATISEALGLNGDPEEVDMLERKIEALNNKMLTLVNESVSSGDGIEAHESEFMTLSQEAELLKQRIAAIQESTAKDNGEQSRLEQIQAIISERESKCMEYDDSIVRQMVECIKVYPGGKLEIIFGGGYLVEESV